MASSSDPVIRLPSGATDATPCNTPRAVFPGTPVAAKVWDDGLDVISPAVTHAPCSLDQQRRVREARAGALARWTGRRKGSGRAGDRPSPSADQVTGLGRRGEDVWSALRT
jgi:hypothetical protein